MARAETVGRKTGCALRALRVVLSLGLMGLVAGMVGAAGLALAYHRVVVQEPGPHLERDAIRGIIAQESPVYYRDGTSRVGVFFDEEHRQFVRLDELPLAYVVGLVAAEDADFWSHPGIAVRGIARAMRDNLRAGAVVAGGSTLTQQTAKNLYYRPDRSLKSKGIELLNALRLEAHFDKSEILEFYVNQFHVSGNGRGVGIAARHFFDKDVGELDTAEAAFLAGLVKAPSHYDPFLGDKARREKAVLRAHQRTRYVLERLAGEDATELAGGLAADRVTAVRAVQVEARQLLDEGFELPFRRGAFRYDSSAVLDEVARRLAEPPLDQVLVEAGVTDAATAGLQVITTLDADAQRAAVYGLWHHLTEAGTMLEGLGPEAFVRTKSSGPRYDPDFPPRAREFRLARITELVEAPALHLQVDLGGHTCVVDRDAIVRAAVAVWRGAKGDSRARAPTAEVDAFARALPVGAVVQVSVRDLPPEGPARCDLELRPELQGSVLVLQDGQIRAMVGGNDNRNFNRATALRQMGSTWKPLVFHAALELGRSPVDPLDNRLNVFPFSTTFYYPRPDHEPDPVVSIAWAGVNSENLASVWLLYHLTDDLDGDQVRALAESLDLARRPEEATADYRRRIQLAGVLPTRSRVDEALFLQARQEVVRGLKHSAHPEDELALRSLLFGWGHTAERARVAREAPSRRAWKLRALDNSWQHLRTRVPACEVQHGELARGLEDGALPEVERVPDLSVLVDGERIEVACGALPEGYVAPHEADLVPELPPEPIVVGPDVELEPEPEPKRRRSLWRRAIEPEAEEEPEVEEPTGPQLAPVEDLLVDDRLHLSTLRALDSGLQRRQLALEAGGRPDLYAPELLYWHQDFRVLLALRYVTALAEQYGVQTELPPVLSLPLGASEITLEEAASLYAGLALGARWELGGRAHGREAEAPPTPSLLISEIRDVDGRVLYRAEPTRVPVSEPHTAAQTLDILRNVVRWGTGRRALHAVRLGGAAVPVGGKTGTTNDFKNAAFLGVVPVASPGGFAAEGGYVVGAYVGYDDNRSMQRKRITLAGSSGALPAWIGTSQGLAELGLLGTDPTGIREGDRWAPAVAGGLERAPVVPEIGLPSDEPFDPEAPSALVIETTRVPPPHTSFERIDRPARLAPTTEEAVRERPRRMLPLRRRQPEDP